MPFALSIDGHGPKGRGENIIGLLCEAGDQERKDMRVKDLGPVTYYALSEPAMGANFGPGPVPESR